MELLSSQDYDDDGDYDDGYNFDNSETIEY